MGRVEQARAAGGDRATTRDLSEVEKVIVQTANVPAAAVHPGATLSADLGLDSLGRIDLLGAIEEELGAYIDDATVEANATVADLERMVAEAREVKRDTGIYGWPLSPLVRSFGLLLQQTFIYPLVHIFYKVKITGKEKLERLRGPVMFAPNHCLHWDNGIILMAIPLAWRWKLTMAAAADDVFGSKLNGLVSSILANAFPLAREGATPVVPMKLKIKKVSVLDHGDRKWEASRSNGWRGDVEVVFGDPLYFPAGTPANEATAKIQSAVGAL